MAVLRFKPVFLERIVRPEIIEAGALRVGHFKTYTTRLKPKKVGEYEVICGIPPKPMFNQLKTGIIIEIYEVQTKAIKEYEAEELIGDVGHCDLQRFIDTLNAINHSRKSAQFTGDWQGCLHQFRYVGGGENVSKTVTEIERLWTEYRASRAMVICNLSSKKCKKLKCPCARPHVEKTCKMECYRPDDMSAVNSKCEPVKVK